MKKLTLSASQYKKADRCLKAWGWKYIMKLKEPTSPAAAQGQEAHARLEKYLEAGDLAKLHGPDGRPDALTERLKHGVKYLPPPSPNLEIERHMKTEIGGVTYQGYIDLHWIDAKGEHWILDHKTTGKIGPFSLTTKTLPHDMQALIYAKMIFDEDPNAQRVNLRWVYYQLRNGIRSQAVDAQLTREETLSRLGGMIPEKSQRLERLYQIRTKPEQEKLAQVRNFPENNKACGDFGGCAFIEVCQPKAPSLFKETNMSQPNPLLNAVQGNANPVTQQRQAPPRVNSPEMEQAQQFQEQQRQLAEQQRQLEEQQRQLAEQQAAMNATQPAAAATAEPAVSPNKLKQDEILALVSDGQEHCVARSSKLVGQYPYVAGRSLNVLASNGKIEIVKEETQLSWIRLPQNATPPAPAAEPPQTHHVPIPAAPPLNNPPAVHPGSQPTTPAPVTPAAEAPATANPLLAAVSPEAAGPKDEPPTRKATPNSPAEQMVFAEIFKALMLNAGDLRNMNRERLDEILDSARHVHKWTRNV